MHLGTYSTTGEPISISDADRSQHLYAIGQSGTGKTTSLLSLMAQDLREGRGFCFIDKHGDAAIRDNQGQQIWLPTDLPSLDEGPLSRLRRLI